ncbi:adenosine 5'-phosphosulfate reductase-like2 [Hibiscus syriacus]|uniref:Adenosine 5'-phosphosulfate reductase-like2 n=1 Tax=Hibiscus syriacus TaxID=106335 RepID=A0A6A3CBS4_HIBSY|nr:adenosine 5'-phosphosulfate reductase-like2 [Hibiscus syriacus]
MPHKILQALFSPVWRRFLRQFCLLGYLSVGLLNSSGCLPHGGLVNILWRCVFWECCDIFICWQDGIRKSMEIIGQLREYLLEEHCGLSKAKIIFAAENCYIDVLALQEMLSRCCSSRLSSRRLGESSGLGQLARAVVIWNERPNVSVNGQPISDYAVKETEKRAGPIHPGNYWYDPRTGFWGVMGQSCSGIIPPFIEEFDYPMAKNCAAGNTVVLINGRELHQKDLELLAVKGFPTARDKSYIIEFLG